MRKTGKVPPAQTPPEEVRRQRIEHARAIRGDGFLFSGNRQQCVPADMLLDRRLTPLDRNAWMAFRLLLNDDGLTAFPTYEQLRQHLSASPGALASPETVSKVLTVLRLTRWLSLVGRRRDPQTGRPLGNVYVLHDSPLTPFEAMELDPNYLELLGHSLTSKSKAIGTVVQIVLEEIGQDPALKAKGLPTRLEMLRQRLTGRDAQESYPQDNETVDPKNRLRFDTTESVVPRKPAKNGGLRFEGGDSTVRSSSVYKIRTVQNLSSVEAPSATVSAASAQALRLPQAFTRLQEKHQQGALAALGTLPVELQQAILDEWAERCRTDAIRRPAHYLFGIIQKAIRGEFNATRSKPADTQRLIAQPPQPPPAPVVAPEKARLYFSRLREMMHMPPHQNNGNP
ncbi:MAG: STY4528 family pathogenicity island replication protein [Betaproteobacteria bacterium]|nr:STY4528 family pathogenicity island replication protein [Betaproteobacteria bacterium]